MKKMNRRSFIGSATMAAAASVPTIYSRVATDFGMSDLEKLIRVTLPAALAGPAAELAAAEQQCCPFFRFTLVFDGGVLQLTMQALPEAAPLLTALADDFAPTPSSYPA